MFKKQIIALLITALASLNVLAEEEQASGFELFNPSSWFSDSDSTESKPADNVNNINLAHPPRLVYVYEPTELLADDEPGSLQPVLEPADLYKDDEPNDGNDG